MKALQRAILFAWLALWMTTTLTQAKGPPPIAKLTISGPGLNGIIEVTEVA